MGECYKTNIRFSKKILACEVRSHLENRFKVRDYWSIEYLMNGFKVDYQKFIVEDMAEVLVIDEGETTQIVFRVCFANFEKNINRVFEICKYSSTLDKDATMNSIYDICAFSYQDFYSLISCNFSFDIMNFEERYNKINRTILPTNFFKWYNFIWRMK